MKGVQLLWTCLLLSTVGVTGYQRLYWDMENNSRITYTVENKLTDHPFSADIEVIQPAGKVFLEYMKDAATREAIFKFKCKYFEKLGCYVEEINGLAEDTSKQTFWAFMKRDEKTGDCLQTVGVSTYVPRSGEHLVMSYKTYDIFHELPSCKTAQPNL